MRDNRIYLNTKLMTLETLKSGLEALHVKETDVVIINADKQVLHGLVVGVMDEARKAGVVRFAIATDRG